MNLIEIQILQAPIIRPVRGSTIILYVPFRIQILIFHSCFILVYRSVEYSLYLLSLLEVSTANIIWPVEALQLF